jgi:hypothetical protein
LRNGDDGSEAHLTKEVKPGVEAQGTVIATQLNAGQRPIGFEVSSTFAYNNPSSLRRITITTITPII